MIKDDINKLKKEIGLKFPKGCDDLECAECELNECEEGSTNALICNLLQSIEYKTRDN